MEIITTLIIIIFIAIFLWFLKAFFKWGKNINKLVKKDSGINELIFFDD